MDILALWLAFMCALTISPAFAFVAARHVSVIHRLRDCPSPRFLSHATLVTHALLSRYIALHCLPCHLASTTDAYKPVGRESRCDLVMGQRAGRDEAQFTIQRVTCVAKLHVVFVLTKHSFSNSLN